MENASRALVMAAGVLLGLLIISALVYAYNEYQSLGDMQESIAAIESIVEFNQQFETYNRDGVRGNDLVSLINKIISYNETQADKYGYGKLEITIDFNGNSSKFIYDNESPSGYWMSNVSAITSAAMMETKLDTIYDLESKYGSTEICTQLIAKIGSMTSANYKDYLTAVGCKNTSISYSTVISEMKQYYEYVVFKRGYYDCISTTMDENTGRITGFKFKFTGKIN